MRMYGTFTAKSLDCAPYIDFFEFKFPELPDKFIPEDLKGETDLVLTVDWDESDWDFDEETGEGSFRAKGVMINQEYANGHLDLFRKASLNNLQVHALPDSDFRLTGLTVEDGDEWLEMDEESIDPAWTGYSE